MRSLIRLLFPVLALFTFSCEMDDLGGGMDRDIEVEKAIRERLGADWAAQLTLPASDDYAHIPQDPLNPLTPEKVALGKLLYHEPGFGIAPMKSVSAGTYSCASCHSAQAGFQAGRAQGIGEGGIGFGVAGEGRMPHPDYQPEELDVQPVRSPSALNIAYQEVILWNGQFGAQGINESTDYSWTEGTPKETNHLGFSGVETQAIAGLKVHRMNVTPSAVDSLGYKGLFDAAFGDVSEEERYSKITAGLAIAAYERTLLANQSPFQQWLQGNSDALTDQEKIGARLFFGKAECVDCHTGPALNSMAFYALGMNDFLDIPEPTFQVDPNDPAHLGRGGFTNRPEDMYKFKVPQLYNLIDSPFFGHGSSFHSIKSVLTYKNNAVPENPRVPQAQLASGFVPLNLTNEELDALTAFLERGLRDPDLMRYVPESLPSGQCFPNNDPQSKDDLGCN